MVNLDFGPKHLMGLSWLLPLIAVVLIILVSIKKIGKFDEKFDRAVIRYTCYFMWAWEIVKTIIIVNADQPVDMNIMTYGPVGYYPVFMAPFHICSMGLYAYLIVGAKKPSKLAEWVKPFAYAVLMIVTSIILAIPASSSVLGHIPDWSFCFDNILPYQSWLYHGSLLFVSFYMVFSGFYRPKWSDIPKGAIVLAVTAAFSQALNYIFEGSGADFMTLRYGRGNPFAYLLEGPNPEYYYILLAAIAIGGMSLIIAITIGIRALVDKCRAKKNA